METTNIISNKDKFISLTESHSSALGTIVPDIVATAKADLLQMEIPTTRHEEWKYTRTTKLSQENWKFSNAESKLPNDAFLISDLNASRIVFVNGKWDASQSEIKNEAGVSIFTSENITTDFISKIDITPSANFFEASKKLHAQIWLPFTLQKTK
ncbi:MAG: hypothetical protein R2809_12695 [Flavobacteriales bacterium]